MNKMIGAINLIRKNGVNYTIGMWVVPRAELQKIEVEGFAWQATEKLIWLQVPTIKFAVAASTVGCWRKPMR